MYSVQSRAIQIDSNGLETSRGFCHGDKCAMHVGQVFIHPLVWCGPTHPLHKSKSEWNKCFSKQAL